MVNDDYGGLTPLSFSWSIGAGAVMIAIFVALSSVGLGEKSVISATTGGVFLLIMRAYWGFKKEPWFWLCSLFFLASHLILISTSAIDRFPGPAIVYLFPIVVVDFMVSLGYYWIVKSRFSRSNLGN